MNPETEIRRRTRRSFLVGGLALAAGSAAYRWIAHTEDAGELPPVLRRNLENNERIAATYFRNTHLAKEYPRDRAKMPRGNGDIGLDEDTDVEKWKLKFGDREIALADIRALPRVDSVTELKCIEGWSEVVHWTGARFSDFIAQYAGADRSPYVSMTTPDGEYFVGLDRESAMHPQTLLCYEMNGAPLEQKHGAPLRLVIPVKYGIKNIKRIGSIQLMSERPEDYWANEGYDWYAGL